MDIELFFEKHFETTDGDFHILDGRLFQFFNDFQMILGIKGDIFEIGVHYGRSALLLANFIDPMNEVLHLNDIFEDQYLNISRSGHGSYHIFMKNLERVFGKIEFMKIYKTASQFLNVQELENKVRFFHIDGGHSADETLNDLNLALKSTSEFAVIVVDDVFNRYWPGVVEGLMKFLSNHPPVKPITIGFNKVFLVREEALDSYIRHLGSDTFSDFLVRHGLGAQKQIWMGNDVIIIESRGMYQCELGSEKEHYELSCGEGYSFPIKLKNLSSVPLETTEYKKIYLTYHLLNAQMKTISWDNIRTPFSDSIKPGKVSTIELEIDPLMEKGEFYIEVDCVYENVMWFKDGGSRTLLIGVEVK